MPEALGLKIRKALSRAVKPIYTSDDGWKLRQELKRKALELKINVLYRLCADSDKPMRDCYEDVAKDVGLSREYLGIWGVGA